MLRRQFRAMGTEVELVVDAPLGARAFGAVAEAELELRRLERLLSRFEPGSELSRLNLSRRMAVGRSCSSWSSYRSPHASARWDASTRPCTTPSSLPATTAPSSECLQMEPVRA